MRRLASIALSVLFIGCAMKETEKTEKAWVLAKMNDKVFKENTFSPVSLTLDLPKNKFYGSDGCNNIFGELKSLKDKISFKSINSTSMLCENMKISDQYIDLLQKSKTYKMDKTSLLLLDKNNNKILEFTKEK